MVEVRGKYLSLDTKIYLDLIHLLQVAYSTCDCLSGHSSLNLFNKLCLDMIHVLLPVLVIALVVTLLYTEQDNLCLTLMI